MYGRTVQRLRLKFRLLSVGRIWPGYVLFVLLFSSSFLCGAAPVQLFSQTHPAMGTLFTIYLYAADSAQAAADFEAAFGEIDRLDATLSNYRPNSELSRINRNAFREAVTTDPEVFEFLRRSFDYARSSGGAFDITVGPLMRAWGFFRGQGHYPSADELKRAQASVGWQRVLLDDAARTVRFQVQGMELDPGGIGKGYAVDQVVSKLRESGVESALVDAGSSTIYALGAPPGKDGWPVQVPRPEERKERKQSISTVLLRDKALSTSGNYEKFFMLNGRLYCHIMDPRTGAPVRGVLQTTVIVPQAIDSDALSTAMFVMGPVRGVKLLESFSQASGLWLLGQPNAEQRVTWHWPGAIPDATDVGRSVVSKSSAMHKSKPGGSSHP